MLVAEDHRHKGPTQYLLLAWIGFTLNGFPTCCFQLGLSRPEHHRPKHLPSELSTSIDHTYPQQLSIQRLGPQHLDFPSKQTNIKITHGAVCRVRTAYQTSHSPVTEGIPPHHHHKNEYAAQIPLGEVFAKYSSSEYLQSLAG